MNFGSSCRRRRRRRGWSISPSGRRRYGFEHVWTFDSHILWQEPYVIYSQILAETRNVVVGPMVTNPATRDWTVTASTYATLNEMYGNRTVCGIGRGDSAVRVTNGAPTTLRRCARRSHVIRELANGRSVDYKGSTIRLPWADEDRLEVWVRRLRTEGAGADRRGRRRLHPAARRPVIAEWTIKAVRDAAEAAGRDPDASRSASPRPPTSTDDRAPTCATSAAGSAAWSATTSPTSSPRYGETLRVPQALTDYIKGRQGYDYNQHGQAGNTHTAFVPDEIVDRFCILGPVDEHVEPAGGAEGARRRPVRDLPAARRQGPHAAGLRRAGDARRRRARAGEVVSERGRRSDPRRHVLVAVRRSRPVRPRAVARRVRVGALQGDRSGRRRRAARRILLAGPATGRCRTCGTCSRGSTEPEGRGGDAADLAVVSPGTTWYSFRLAVVRLRARRGRRASRWRCDGAVPASSSAACCRTS